MKLTPELIQRVKDYYQNTPHEKIIERYNSLYPNEEDTLLQKMILSVDSLPLRDKLNTVIGMTISSIQRHIGREDYTEQEHEKAIEASEELTDWIMDIIVEYITRQK
jgi:hypothetical protein